jgi:hypothetical protein
MGTNAETMRVAARPTGFTPWTAAVAVLAGAALVMSAFALTLAARDTAITDAASGTIATSTLWDTAKVDAMEGRVLAETVETTGLWDTAKVDAMQGRVLAERVRIATALWDESRLEAMEGRVRAG